MKSLGFFIFLLWSSLGHAEVEKSDQQIVSSVMDFYAPIQLDKPRPDDWPEALSFFRPAEPLPVEAVAEMVIGTWTYVYHCRYRPLPLAWLIELALADGWVDPAVVLHLSDDNFYFSKTLPNTLSDLGLTKADHRRVDPIRGGYVVSPSTNEGECRVHFYTNRLMPAYVKPLMVGETGEVVLELRDNLLPQCPTGEPLRALLIPVPMS